MHVVSCCISIGFEVFVKITTTMICYINWYIICISADYQQVCYLVLLNLCWKFSICLFIPMKSYTNSV